MTLDTTISVSFSISNAYLKGIDAVLDYSTKKLQVTLFIKIKSYEASAVPARALA
jgi:hypothetical protein